jgi:hypothetical protein
MRASRHPIYASARETGMRQIVAVTAHPWYLGATPLATSRWLVRLRWATALVESVVEWEHMQRVRADGNVSQAARLLGIHRRSLQRKLSKDQSPEAS